jgi:hypothetical protein
MRLFSTFQVLAGLGMALSGLVGCTRKETIGPAEGSCSTVVTVRLCHGYTAFCLTEHTTLELADGTRLRPSGPVWAAYQPNQIDGQVLRIGYQITPRITTDAPGYENATLSCLENVNWCGTR